MATCPSGHESVSDDFCDVCGIRLGAPTLSAVEADASSGMGSLDDTVEVPGPPCPRCGAPRDGQFCEACGWNFAEGAGPAVPATWPDAPVPPPAASPIPSPPSSAPPWAVPSWAAPPSADPSSAAPLSADPSPVGPLSVGPPSPVPPPSASPTPPAPQPRPGLRRPWYDPPPAYDPPSAYDPPPGSTVWDSPVPDIPGPDSTVSDGPGPDGPGPDSSGLDTLSPSGLPSAGLPSAGDAAVVWSATVSADREYFDAVLAASGLDADGIEFPAYCPERRFRLSGREVRIGRRSASRGIEPEIDLTGPPSDPGVSRLHAVLIAAEDGTWSVLDPGSANGTLVNGSEIQANEPVKLREGDRVNLGAWTVLIVSRDN